MTLAFDPGVYLSLLTCVLLALVAGLLVVVALDMRRVKQSMKQAPALGDEASRALLAARQGVEELKTRLVSLGPRVEAQLEDAGKMVQELKFLLERGEAMAARLEGLQAAASRSAPAPQVVASHEDVVQANDQAARKPDGEVGQDPLEELLAGLREAREGVVQALADKGVGGDVVPFGQARGSRVVSRAEEDLRAKAQRKTG